MIIPKIVGGKSRASAIRCQLVYGATVCVPGTQSSFGFFSSNWLTWNCVPATEIPVRGVLFAALGGIATNATCVPVRVLPGAGSHLPTA